MKKYLSLLLLFSVMICSLPMGAQEVSKKEPPFLKYTNSPWVDSIMKSLTPEERIAQLIMVAAYSNR